jgi:hypothetical protein
MEMVGGAMKNQVLAVFVFLTLLVSQALAQQNPELDALDQKIKRNFETRIPGWKHDRVEPVTKGENVLIEFWSLGNRKVKVSILPHNSVDDAREVFKRHERYSLNKEELKGFGDEAVASGYGASDLAFRRGRYTVYIRAAADVDADADARSLSQSQRFEREKSEMRRLSREFAKHVADALEAP